MTGAFLDGMHLQVQRLAMVFSKVFQAGRRWKCRPMHRGKHGSICAASSLWHGAAALGYALGHPSIVMLGGDLARVPLSAASSSRFPSWR
jgi:hypothetical protein